MRRAATSKESQDSTSWLWHANNAESEKRTFFNRNSGLLLIDEVNLLPKKTFRRTFIATAHWMSAAAAIINSRAVIFDWQVFWCFRKNGIFDGQAGKMLKSELNQQQIGLPRMTWACSAQTVDIPTSWYWVYFGLLMLFFLLSFRMLPAELRLS